MEHELYLGKIIGYRLWQPHVTARTIKTDWEHTPWGSHSYLCSVNNNIKWPVEKVTARCIISQQKKRFKTFTHDSAPSNLCSCGLYAKYFTTTAETYNSLFILGVIYGWGKTILGTNGFRCQYARIVALYNGMGSGIHKYHYTCHVASFYKVPCYTRIEQMKKDFPPVHPEDFGAGSYNSYWRPF